MSGTRMILVSAPSGAGKNSFMEKAMADFPRLKDVITYTTRPRRTGESEEAYHFTDKKNFQELVGQEFFAEWCHVHDSMYGTPRQGLESAWADGQVVIMDIDVQGVRKLKELYPDAVSVFILPPSIDELRKRILARDKKAPSNLELRLENAKKEIELAPEYDYQVINDEFEPSYQKFKKIVEELLSF